MRCDVNGSTTKCRGVKPSAGFKGFTLIELMITVAIIAILATIALPSYMNSVRKSKRAEAKSCLLTAAQLEERYYYQNNTYGTIALIGAAAACTGGNYTIADNGTATATGFTLTATPVAGTTQASDAYCTTLTLKNTGAKDATGSDKTQCW